MKICLSRDLADRLAADVERIVPGAEIVRLGSDGRFDGDVDGVEIFLFSVGLSAVPEAMAAAARILGEPTLRWVQSPGAGVDHPIWAQLLGRGVRVSSAAGIHAEPIAQYIFTYVLHWERNVARHQAQQASRTWQAIRSDDLTRRTLGIVGMGGIGAAAARIAKAFGMRVVATRRSPVHDPNVDLLVPPERLHELLGEAHYVVLCLPLTPETRHRIGAAELAAMRSDAVLINVARGGVVDEAALIDSLREGRIRGASLDVVEAEPLPADSPLWTLPNCVLTPHDAGSSPRADERLAALFLENLERLVRGEALRNEVTSAPS
ncbi:MAG: D-2-hydroxyacid dehydrogenase [Myxococcota bacterium]